MAEVVAVIDAGCGRLRARVVRLPGGVFAIDVERMFDATDSDGVKRGEFWSAVHRPASYTDSLEGATVLAEQALRDHRSVETCGGSEPL